MDFIMPLINGKSYSWSDIKLILFGQRVVGITSIDYEEEQEKENIYGAGNSPVSRGTGNKKPTASITLSSEEVSALEAAAPNGNVCDIPMFDIVVNYTNNNRTETHVLKNCEFTKDSRKSKQNDKSIEVEMPLILSHIVWKV